MSGNLGFETWVVGHACATFDLEGPDRSLEDTLFLGRAHSLGWRRQQVEMLGWAVMVNALTMARHRTAESLEAAA